MLELFGMFVLALAPIIWLVIALCGLHMEAYVAASARSSSPRSAPSSAGA